MPITQSEIKFYYTGGSANGNPSNSLGGTISSVEIISSNLHNLFDKVSGDEASGGKTEWRCIAVKNTNSTLTWENVMAHIAINTPAGDEISISAEKPISNAVQTIANETTAPTGITFSSPSTRATGLVCTGEGNTNGNVGSGKWFAIWVRRTVPPNTTGYSNNYATLVVSGDTAI